MSLTIYAAMKNSDMTEGRGPMEVDCYFADHIHAEEYIDTKTGVMGRKSKWSEQKHGDWTVKPIEVITGPHPSFDKKRKVKEALSKLDKDEIEALGIDPDKLL